MTVNVVDAGPRQVSRSVEVAAPAAELYAWAADPWRHRELDGSGTVRDNIKMPTELVVGSKFSTNMKMYGVPYRITSTVTALKTQRSGRMAPPGGPPLAVGIRVALTDADQGYRDVRLSRGRRDQEQAEVLRADGFPKSQRGRHRGDTSQPARSLRRAVGDQPIAGSAASHATAPDTQWVNWSAWSLWYR